MNVLIVTTELGALRYFGGLGTHVNDLVAALRAGGHRVVVVLNYLDDHRPTAHVRVDGLDVIEVSADPLDTAAADRLGLERRTREIERVVHDLAFRPEVIHGHDAWNFPFARGLGTRLGLPVVSTVHSFMLMHPFPDVSKVRAVQAEIDARIAAGGPPLAWPDPLSGEHEYDYYDTLLYWIERAMMQRSARLIYPTLHAAELGRVLYESDFDPARSRVVHHGIALESCERREIDLPILRRVAAAAEGGCKVVVFAGRLAEQKGVGPLLEAVVQAKARGPRFHLLVCGTGELDEPLRAQVVSSGLADDVTFAGFVAKEELLQVFHRADVGVVPSIWEPFGYVAIEMLACGLPTVVNAVDGLDMIVEHERSGYKVPLIRRGTERSIEVDVPALAAALVAALTLAPAARARIAAEAIRRVREEFSIGAMLARTLEVYRDAIATPDGAGYAPAGQTG